jgi:hypothetical protein
LEKISTGHIVWVGHFSLANIVAANVELASSRGFPTDDTHIRDQACRIATAEN